MANWIFVLLTVLIASDLNGFASSLLGVSGFLSPLILGLTCFLFVRAYFMRLPTPSHTKYMLFFFGFWLIVGTVIFELVGNTDGNPYEKIRYYIPSALLLFTFSKIILDFVRSGRYQSIIDTLTVGLIFNCIAIIYSSQFEGGLFDDSIVDGRSSGFIVSANQAGVTASMAQVFILYQYLLTPETRRSKLLIVGGYCIAVYAGFLTFSKAAFFNALAIGITFLIYIVRIQYNDDFRQYIWTRNKRLFVTLIVGLCSVFAVFAGAWMDGLSAAQTKRIDEFISLLSGNINEQTTTGRSLIAIKAIEYINFDNYMGRGLGTFHSIEGINYGTHNMFLLILGEVGFLGLLFYLLYFVSVYIGIMRIQDRLIGFLLFSLTNVLLVTSLVSHNVLFIKLYILILAFINAVIFFRLRAQQLLYQMGGR